LGVEKKVEEARKEEGRFPERIPATKLSFRAGQIWMMQRLEWLEERFVVRMDWSQEGVCLRQ
jgi:hypothetical protein